MKYQEIVDILNAIRREQVDPKRQEALDEACDIVMTHATEQFNRASGEIDAILSGRKEIFPDEHLLP